MFNQTIGCVNPNFSARKCLRLSLLLLIPLAVQFAHSLNAQASGERPSLGQESRNRSVPGADRVPRRRIPARVVATGSGLLGARADPSRPPYPVATAPGTDSPATRLVHRRSRVIKGKTVALNTQESTTLELGKPIERELAAGQKHNYEVALTEGQFIIVQIKLRGIDVRMTLQKPNGNSLEMFNGLGSAQEGKIPLVAASSGVYRFTIHARAKAPAGLYEIHLAELRMATENERALQEASELMVKCIGLNREGRYSEARLLLMRVLEVREKLLGPDSLALDQPLNLLASTFEDTGDYVRAEPLRLRALKIVEKRWGPEHPEVANQLNHLASHYQKKGDDLKAEEADQRALVILEKAQRMGSYEAASLLGALGSIYYSRGDYESAERYYQRSRAVWENLLGPDHFHLEPTFIFLGRVAYDAGDYAKAKAMFERALTLREKALGQGESGIPRRLNDLAMLYATTGDYAKAESLYLRALSIYEKGGMSDPNVQETLFGLARLYGAQGRASAAVKFQSQASEIEERHVELNLAVGSERERKAFLANFALRASRNVSLHTNLAPDDGAARNLAVTTLLQRKGRIQDALSESLAGLRRRANAEDQALFDELTNATSQLARLILAGPQNRALAEHQAKVKTLEEQRERLEAEISRRSSGFYEGAQPITLAAVQAAIPEREALVEFAVYRPFDPKAPDNQKAYGEPRYVAYVIRHQGEVRWTELGAAKEIDSAVDALRHALRDPRRKDVQQLARAVDEKLMRPVRALVGDTAQLLVSPDGELNLIPFEALVDEQGRYLVERYAFTYLTSGRDLLRMQVARAGGSKPLVVANPSFGEPTTEQIASVYAVRKPTAPGGRRRSVTAGSDLSDVYFAPLGGTAQEARTIRTLFPEANLLIGAQATESALKQIAAPSVLHIATHGFFLSEPGAVATGSVAQVTTRGVNANAQSVGGTVAIGSVAQVTMRGINANAQSVPGTIATGSVANVTTRGINANAQSVPGAVATGSVAQVTTRGVNANAQSVGGTVAIGSVAQVTMRGINANAQSVPGTIATGSVANVTTRGINASAKIENPLLRSGLALAGANLRGGAANDDGILTALEASGLNLWGTKLVVLSACDTGLGEVRNGEGVYGLRRAFVLAGAESMIMSLWPVSDYSTRKLMTDYYRNLKLGLGRGAALRQVQLDLLRRNKQLHPFFWANFIQSGEWANLDGKR